MNFKKLGKNLLWGVLVIFVIWWVWRWVQGQGGILATFNRFFPGRALLPVVTPPTVIRPEQVPPTVRPPRAITPGQIPPTVRHPITRDVEEMAPPAVRPTPYPVVPIRPPAPTVPVELTPIPGISPTDRLPWENNRKRSEVINALAADIVRIERYPRELANTFTEVVRVGGVDNYLSMQRDRLTRARTFPTFPTRLGVAPITIPTPAPAPAPTFPTRLGAAPITIPAPAPIPLPAYTPAPAPSPLTPVQEITGMSTNGEVRIIQAGAVTRAWDEPTVIYIQE